MPTPPEHRTDTMPWPTYPMVYRVSSAHEEGGERLYSVNTTEFVADDEGRLAAIRIVEVSRDADGRFVSIEGTERELPAQLVLLAMGFVGPEKGKLLSDLGVKLDERGNVARDRSFMTNVEGVFSAGDMGRGQSLIVWAIAEGRAAAAGVDGFLTGRTVLPRPINPTDRPLI
jgi:glutamate synthase (NADPH/NADH) small chain